MFGQKKSKRLLTVGLLEGNRPVVAQTLKNGQKVTIGPHKKNTFVIHSAKLPKKFTLLQPKGDRYLLTFLPEMQGKIAVKGSALPLTTLIQRGVVETKKGQHTVSISNRTRGKIVFENCRLLFRFDDA